MRLQLPEEMLLILSVLFVALLMVMVMVFMLYAMKERSRSQYDSERNQARLSEMRESFEARLSEVNYQLMASEQRWKEVNHLILSAQAAQAAQTERFVSKINESQGLWHPRNGSEFLHQMGIDPDSVSVEKNLVFVLTPFDNYSLDDYNAIKEACSIVGLRCVRGDEEHASGDILKHILSLIVKADFIIANISSRNPNVFYELGIAQAMGKDAVLVARDNSNLSFDLQSQRILLYKNSKDLPEKLKEMLLRIILNRKSV